MVPRNPTTQPVVSVRAKPSLAEAVTALRLTWRLLRDRRVPLWAKLVPLGALLYVLLPYDILPDVLPGLGQVDDAILLWAAYRFFVWLCPSEVVDEHRAALARRLTPGTG